MSQELGLHEYKFSPAALRRAWDARVRRGDNLLYLFPELEPVHAQVREAKAKSRDELKLYKNDSPLRETVKERHRQQIEALEAIYDSTLQTALERTAMEIQKILESGDYGLCIKTKPPLSSDPRKRPLYALDQNTGASYFLARQVEYELKTQTRRSMSDRNMLTRQLATALENTKGKIVIRTDIEQFYESIEHSKIRSLLRDSHHLSRTAYTYLDQLLDSYAQTVGSKKGIPRGMAISARIAEIYMANVDQNIPMDGVIMYLRYVDDIVIVANALPGLPTLGQHMDRLKKIIVSHGLFLNATKTKAFQTPSEKNFKENVEFLGYDYILTERGVKLDISKKRFDRYKQRVLISLDAHLQQNTQRSYLMLVERMRYLMGNTRLSNNRRQALIGIYFSNSALPEVGTRIRALDAFTRQEIQKRIADPEQAKQLLRMNFEDGFRRRTFSALSPGRISSIVKVWKHVI
ncbi:RNA-directed DNA polymerase [Arthrobacter sp. zg-Y411]|uniref:antiviral reverse transcriptase Drt3a n=1 Tax=Arthrobacter zhangbolii TaxID=2886936 RepID=UPI001D15CAD2|nr:antiviral reverse transcriptase Drt3a [Arthrobacter zhangbolii]MCC3293774.1 RNA-directed DNA polymerase [Arthrobacter zhangbolii]